MNAVPRSQPVVRIISEMDELLDEAIGHNVVRITSVAGLLGGHQRWTVAVTTTSGVVSVGKSDRVESALRAALKALP